MSGELAEIQNSVPAAPVAQQTGKNNIHVTNQNGGTVNFNINYQQSMAGSSAEEMIAVRSFSKEYYQLIVTCEDDIFQTKVVTVQASRALTQGTVPPEIFKRCSTLTDAGIEELKHIPAIICMENTEMRGNTAPTQWGMYSYIKAIRKMGNNIKIVFEPLEPVQQIKLCDKRSAVFFDLNMDCAITDLNHSAWTVHKINVFEAFDEAEIPISKRPL